MDRNQIESIVRAVLEKMPARERTQSHHMDIPVEVSARHVHLSAEHARQLFGTDLLKQKHMLSQPGQFLSEKYIRLLGPKGSIDRVAVLGPVRGATQVEISMTDARRLGIDAPLRLSGDLRGAAGIHLQAGNEVVSADAAIIAQRHLHVTPPDAQSLALADGQEVSVRVRGNRPLVFDAVRVRVSTDAATALHIDTDEANAAGFFPDCTGHVVGRGSTELDAPKAPAEKACGFDGKLLTEASAMELIRAGLKEIQIKRGQIVTPSARDVLRTHGVVLRQEGTL